MESIGIWAWKRDGELGAQGLGSQARVVPKRDTTSRRGVCGTPRYVIGPTISWPAFDLGRVRAGVNAARAEASEMRVRLDLTVAQAEEELEASLSNYSKARERLKHLEDAATASTRAAELARLRYEEGASDFLPVLDAERSLLDRENERALGRTAADVGLMAVYRAIGGATEHLAVQSR